MAIERYIAPFKVLAIAFEMVAIISTFHTFQDNIVANQLSVTSTSDDLYIIARTIIFSASAVSLFTIFLQLLIIFQGLTIWQVIISLLCIFLHNLGCILWTSFSYWTWPPFAGWAIWAATCLPCLLLETGGAIRTALKLKRSQ